MAPIQDKVFKLLFGAHGSSLEPKEGSEGVSGSQSEADASDRTTTVRHFKTKVAQRLGLSLLPVRECPWQYKRQKKNLLASFGRELDTKALIRTNEDQLD